jgi:hypothetical protein
VNDRFSSGGQVSSTRSLFVDASLNYTYVGEQKIRNIWTDKFEAHEERSFAFGNFTQTVEYWFAVPDWKIMGFGVHVVPIR